MDENAIVRLCCCVPVDAAQTAPCRPSRIPIGCSSDVVIIDFRMPGMGGLSAARLIDHRLPGTVILLQSAHRDDIIETNATKYVVFWVVDKTNGQNLSPSPAKPIRQGTRSHFPESRYLHNISPH